MGNEKKKEKNGIFQRNRNLSGVFPSTDYVSMSGISFYKLCFLKQHRSISASLAFLKIILLIALLTFKFCYRRQV